MSSTRGQDLIEIVTRVNGHSVITLLDPGATRSCVKHNAAFLQRTPTWSDSTRILAADQSTMSNHGCCQIDVDIQGKTHTIRPLIVESLSYSLLLGLDFITELAFRSSHSFVSLNDTLIPRYNPILPNDRHETACSAVIAVPPTMEHTLYIDNPLFGSPVDFISVEPNRTRHSDVIVNNMVYSNNKPSIPVILTNPTAVDQMFRPKKMISISPVKDTQANINGLQVIDSNQESIDAANFQADRKARFFPDDFMPPLGQIGTHLTSHRKDELSNLLFKYKLAFSAGDSDLGCLHYYRFTMPFKDETESAFEPSRPVPYGLQPKVTSQLNTWIQRDMIEKSASRHNVPLLIIRKSDGSVRTSLDARKLNTLLIPDRHPLPNLREQVHRLGRRIKTGNETFITQLDLAKGFWQMRCSPADREKLAFSYNGDQYVSNRSLYGVATVPAAFCRMVSSIFGHLPDVFCYFDDLALVSGSWDDHMTTLTQVLTLAIKHGINFSGHKSRFACEKMRFLGYDVSKAGIKSSVCHLEKVRDYPTPLNRAELKRFLGLCAFTSRMVRQASIILAPLHTLCSPKSDYVWTEKHQNAFQLFKTALADSTGLSHRDESLPLILCTDASLDKYGAVLYQSHNGELQPLAFHSGLFSRADRRLSSRHRELYAIVYSIRKLEYELIGQSFQITTDHRSLVQILAAKFRGEVTMKMVNALIYLLNFEFTVTYSPGNSPIMAPSDALSRAKISKAEIIELAERDPIPEKLFFISCIPKTLDNHPDKSRYYLRSAARIIEDPKSESKNNETSQSHALRIAERLYSLEEFKALQSKCLKCSNIIAKLALKGKSVTKKFALIDNVLFAIKGTHKRLVIPFDLSEDLVNYVHVVFGHPGTHQMLSMLKQYVFIHNIVNLVKHVIGSCFACATTKSRPPLKASIDKPKQYTNRPWATTHADLWDNGKADRRGKRYLLGIIDALTGYFDAIPLASKKADTVSEAFLTLCLRHGLFDCKVITDNGGEFGQTWTRLCEKLSNIHIHSSPWNSRGNSPIERRFRDLNQLLRSNNVPSTCWSEQIDLILFYANNCPKQSLNGLTPTEALFGRSITIPILQAQDCTDEADFMKNLNRYVKNTHNQLAQLRNQRFQSLHKTIPAKLHVGDTVVAYSPEVKHSKLTSAWSGPYTIRKKLTQASFEIEDEETHQTLRRHIRHLRPLNTKKFQSSSSLSC